MEIVNKGTSDISNTENKVGKVALKVGKSKLQCINMEMINKGCDSETMNR